MATVLRTINYETQDDQKRCRNGARYVTHEYIEYFLPAPASPGLL